MFVTIISASGWCNAGESIIARAPAFIDGHNGWCGSPDGCVVKAASSAGCVRPDRIATVATIAPARAIPACTAMVGRTPAVVTSRPPRPGPAIQASDSTVDSNPLAAARSSSGVVRETSAAIDG